MAIQVMAMAGGNGIESDVIKAGLAFIKYMENEDGSWSSGLTFDQQRMDQACGYAVGRTVWALGSLYRKTESDEVKDVAFSLLYKLLMQKSELSDVNAKACALIGAAHVLESGNPDPDLYESVKLYADHILRMIPEELGNKWQWFEDELTGNYGVIPLALAYAHRVVGGSKYLSAARRTCRFIEKLLFADGVFNPSIVGHSKEKLKLTKGQDQSSNEAFYMVACYTKLFDITREPVYLNQLNKAHFWYLGENNQMKSVYDHSRGGCYEGLSIRGVVPNKGTKSTCSYWLSHYTYLEAYFKELESVGK